MRFTLGNPAAALRPFLKGQKALSLGPILILRLDGRTIGKTMLTREDWNTIIFYPERTPWKHVLEGGSY